LSKPKLKEKEQFMQDQVKKLSFFEKAGYGLGDASANFVFMTMILFQLNFYTDTMGISAAIAGMILLVGRLWDAFFDPMMGVIADRTNTRWDKFRPWVLWTAIPWGIMMVLAYTVPGFSKPMTILYACLTNILLMTLYSANNTPYSAMTAVMTGDVNERTTLSSFRFVAAMIAQLIVGGFTLPLVAKFGQGNNAKGWQMTMGLWAMICIAFFVVTFLTTRERIKPDPKQGKSSGQDFKNLLQNGPWIAMFILALSHFIYVAMRGGGMYYYFIYYVDKDSILKMLSMLGLGAIADGSGGFGHSLLNYLGLIVNADKSNVSSVGYSLFNIFSQLTTVIGVVMSTFLAMKFGKRAVAIVCFSLTTIFMIMFILLPAGKLGATFALEFIRALSYAPTIPLIWAMFADVVDYAEWTTGRRTTGVIYATILFGLKLGLSLGGAITGWLLWGYGYVANAAQTPLALKGIRMTVSIYPAIFLVIIVVCLSRYKINKKLNLQIQDELTERRKKFQIV
jgi:glycoside/pentoside/hexuronide:cation symporter, GPH family